MNKPLSQEELGEKLCNYCSLEDSQKGTHCYGGEPVMCVDSGCCVQAYENYLEEFEEANEEMDNLEKATLINKLASGINQHKENIEGLKDRQIKFRDNEGATIALNCYYNFGASIEADETLIECMIVQEKARLSKAEKELDELLNGDVNRIKAMLNKDGES